MQREMAEAAYDALKRHIEILRVLVRVDRDHSMIGPNSRKRTSICLQVKFCYGKHTHNAFLTRQMSNQFLRRHQLHSISPRLKICPLSELTNLAIQTAIYDCLDVALEPIQFDAVIGEGPEHMITDLEDTCDSPAAIGKYRIPIEVHSHCVMYTSRLDSSPMLAQLLPSQAVKEILHAAKAKECKKVNFREFT